MGCILCIRSVRGFSSDIENSRMSSEFEGIALIDIRVGVILGGWGFSWRDGLGTGRRNVRLPSTAFFWFVVYTCGFRVMLGGEYVVDIRGAVIGTVLG